MWPVVGLTHEKQNILGVEIKDGIEVKGDASTAVI